MLGRVFQSEKVSDEGKVSEKKRMNHYRIVMRGGLPTGIRQMFMLEK